MQALRRQSSRLAKNWRSLSSSTCKYWPIVPLPDEDSPRLVLEPLKDRSLMYVRGQDADVFLQGLITNDIAHLQSRPNFASMYTLFLNRSGRVLYDAIIYRSTAPNTYLIECDRSIAEELRRHLRLFLVRRKIDIASASDDFSIWTGFSAQNSLNLKPDFSAEVLTCHDPRLPTLGLRLLTNPDETLQTLTQRFASGSQSCVEGPSEDCNYRLLRYQLGVGEGVEELPPGKCFPLEANADYLNGISFQKGCYVGQELTARSYHTGVIRKRLMPLRLDSEDTGEMTDIQNEAGTKVGRLRGIYRKRGLALLYITKALQAPALLINGKTCYAERPFWWPAEQPNLNASR